jgi:hypothetical protein
MTSTSLRGTLDSVASLLAASLYQGNPDMNHKLWNIVSTKMRVAIKKTDHATRASWTPGKYGVVCSVHNDISSPIKDIGFSVSGLLC